MCCMNSVLEEEITSGKFAQSLKTQWCLDETNAANAMNIRTACFEVWIAAATAYEEMSAVCLLIHVLRQPTSFFSSLFSAITVNLTKHDRGKSTVMAENNEEKKNAG